jgi:hypothetical protein
MYCQLLMTDVEAGQKYLHFRQVLSWCSCCLGNHDLGYKLKVEKTFQTF